MTVQYLLGQSVKKILQKNTEDRSEVFCPASERVVLESLLFLDNTVLVADSIE